MFAEEQEAARRRAQSLLSERPRSSARAAAAGAGLLKGADTRKLGLAFAGLLVVVAVILMFVVPKTGAIVVTVAGPGDVAVEGVRVLVDDVERCPNSPCRIEDLPAGVHIIKATAPGYAPMAGKPIEVESGEEKPVALALSRGGEDGATGLYVPELGPYLRLSLNGEDRGALPVKLADLAAGNYKVRISGNDRFEVYEEEVTVEAGRVLNLAPRLKVLRGRAKLEAGPGAEGAHVVLECAGDDPLIAQLPTSVEVSVDKPCKVLAKRPGYQDYEQELSFEPGKAEKTFTIELSPGAAVSGGDKGRDKPKIPDAFKPPGAAAAGAKGTIYISSIPPATALVSGRPVGRTPTSTKVPPGSYTVIFLHPKHGRKSVRVNVKAGGRANAAVKFP